MIYPYKAKTFKEGQQIYWETFRQIGDPRVMIMLCTLAAKPMRFSELCHLLETVPERTIARLLKELQKNDFIKRKVYFEIPPRTEYCLTILGREVVPHLRGVWDWMESNWFFVAGAHRAKRMGTLK